MPSLKYRTCTTSTACAINLRKPPKRVMSARLHPPRAIEFMKKVGTDSYVRPKVPFSTTATAMRHMVLVPMNWVVYDFVCARTTRSGGHVSPPLRCIKYFFNNLISINQTAVLFFNSLIPIHQIVLSQQSHLHS